MKKREAFRHLTEKDRDRIHALYGHGHSQVDIGKVLRVNKGTISRELRRYDKKTWRYCATVAQKDAETKRAHSKRPGMKIESDTALKREHRDNVDDLSTATHFHHLLRRQLFIYLYILQKRLFCFMYANFSN